MDRLIQFEDTLLRSRRWLWLAIGATLAVLGGVVAFTTLQLRERIREQIVGRDGEVLYAVAQLYYHEDLAAGFSVGNPVDQLSIVLKCAQLGGVQGVRLYNPLGRFADGIPVDVRDANLAAEDLRALEHLRVVSRFRPRVLRAEVFYVADVAEGQQVMPLLEVNVPLHADDQRLAGVAQFLMEGNSIATEYARLDRRLAWQAVVAFLAGGTVMGTSLAWAFRRLRRAHRLLAERTENLVRANQELALAARTSALGAVTAHLIHGLKNPLAGLHHFVNTHSATPEAKGGPEWLQAVASTRRMQAMIEQIVGVLREEQSGAHYEFTLAELEETIRGRVQTLARERGVNFSVVRQGEALLPNRAANLVALIVTNLTENALQATPPGKTATLVITRAGTRLVFEVRDEGTGFPADTPLFMPCRSGREGGSGIGLALCKQMANHLGAELELASSTPKGCVFALKVPVPVDATNAAEPGRTESEGGVRRPESEL